MIELVELIKYTNNIKLLYVEDNQSAREATLLIFETFFKDITVGVDGQDGLEKFQNSKFDLIISDINMPKMNGLEMIKEIRKIDEDVSILVLSAYNESGFFIDSIKLGVEGYLLKPIDTTQFLGMLAKVIDKVKYREEAEKNLQFLTQYEEATNHSSIVSKTDLKGIITYVNDAFCHISKYTKEELLGTNHNIIRHPSNAKQIYEEMWQQIKQEKKIWQGSIRNRAKDGSSYYVNATIKPILDVNDQIVEYICLRDDITSIMNPKKQLFDAVKSLKSPLVVYLKLEEFIMLEEFYDSETVEYIQEKIKIFLEDNFPQNCQFNKVYQLGNGEYVLVAEKEAYLAEKDLLIKNLKKYQDDIRDGSIDIGDIDYDMSVLMSVSYDRTQALESARIGIDQLLKNKQNFIMANNFAKIEQEKAHANMQMLSTIKKAIETSRIVSYLQPIIDNENQKIVKYESLVRLIKEDGEVLTPYFFLETAKKGRYYSRITRIVLENSFKMLEKIDTEISINLSSKDIEDDLIRKYIFSLLQKYKKDSHRIVFELLEDESIKNFNIISSFITDVKKLGVQIAIDDFGAGYSNFERLLKFQPDILKIDGCLIKNITTDSYSLSVVETIVIFAKKQNIKIIAEYVENEAIFLILKNMGVEYSQGYYFGAPRCLNS